MKPFMINVEMNIITAQGYISNDFDHNVTKDMYDTITTEGYPQTYEYMYQYIKRLDLHDKPLVTYSPDQAISTSTILAMSEKYPNLKIIYLTSKTHLHTLFEPINIKTSTNTIITKLLMRGLKTEQFIVLGVNEQNDDIELLDESGIIYHSLNKITKIDIGLIASSINIFCGKNPVHVIFDMSVMDISVAPCVTRFVYDNVDNLSNIDKNKEDNNFKEIFNTTKINDCKGILLNQIDSIFDSISSLHVVAIDVTSYDTRIIENIKNNIAHRVTCETARRPILKILKIKEKKINIFNEHSKFLIWRHAEQLSPDDVHWFILRGMNLETREKLLSQFNDDTIKIMPIEDGDNEIYVYITVTTLAKQETMSAALTYELTDCALEYNEKFLAPFELINL